MTTTTVEAGSSIAVGYPWRQRFTFTSSPSPEYFPVGATFRATVRKTRTAALSVFELTTANGGLTRVADNSIDVYMSPENTALLDGATSAHFDLVRTDADPSEHLGIRVEVPVSQPITRAE